MVYFLFFGLVFVLTVRNVRLVGGFDKGLDYALGFITAFITTVLMIGVSIGAILLIAPKREVLVVSELVAVELDRTVYATTWEDTYYFVTVDENGAFVVQSRSDVNVGIRHGEPATLTRRYEVIKPSLLLKWGFFVGGGFKVNETEFLTVPLKGVKLDYLLDIDDVLEGNSDE